MNRNAFWHCSVVLTGALLLALDADAWSIGEPIVTYWAGPGFPGHPEKLTDRAAKQLKEGGFNLVWTRSRAELDVAGRHGLRAIYDLDIQSADDLDAIQSKLSARIDAVKDHPALYLYHHADEPSARRFVGLGRIGNWIRARDPKHTTWVNLLPTYANNRQLGVEGNDIIQAYREHVRLFVENYNPDFLSYDHYQFSVGGDGWGYLNNLGIVGHAAAARGIPFMNGVQSCTWVPQKDLASPSSPRIPGVDELRYLVYTTLAYGAQGIYWYVYSYPGHTGAIAELDGTTGDKYKALKALNREFVAIARELRPVRFLGAYLQGRYATGTTPYCEQAVLDVSPKTPLCALEGGADYKDTTLVSRFVSRRTTDRFVVVNMDYRQARTISVSAPGPLERFNAKTGGWTVVGSRLDLPLGKGEGVLLRLAE